MYRLAEIVWAAKKVLITNFKRQSSLKIECPTTQQQCYHQNGLISCCRDTLGEYTVHLVLLMTTLDHYHFACLYFYENVDVLNVNHLGISNKK